MAVDMIAALDRLRALYPKGAVNVSVDVWDCGGRRRTDWSAWIDSEASPEGVGRHIEGHSLAEVMAKVEAEAIQPAKDCEVIVDGIRHDPVPVPTTYPDDDVQF